MTPDEARNAIHAGIAYLIEEDGYDRDAIESFVAQSIGDVFEDRDES